MHRVMRYVAQGTGFGSFCHGRDPALGHWAASGSGERKAQGHVFSWYDCAGVDSTGMADASFFDAPTEASTKKQRIVSKYFGGWANIVLPKTLPREGKIMVMDLFSGPGRYRDGT